MLMRKYDRRMTYHLNVDIGFETGVPATHVKLAVSPSKKDLSVGGISIPSSEIICIKNLSNDAY